MRQLMLACLIGMPLLGSNSLAAPVVVTSIKPLQLIAAAVTDGLSTPTLAVGAGQDPHHLSLRPSERRALQDAAVVLWAGAALELPLVDVVATLGAEVITAQTLDAMQLVSIDNTIDPHFWLDSRNARLIANALAAKLQQLDGVNAARYRANAEQFSTQMDVLDAVLTQQLASLMSKPWAVSHHAFRYFALQHQLQEPLALTDSSNNAPGVRSVVGLREQLVAQHIECLVTEPTENHQQLENLFSGINIVSADVLGRDLAPSFGAYSELLTRLASTLKRCIGGADE